MLPEKLAVSAPRWKHMVNDDALLEEIAQRNRGDIITVKLKKAPDMATLPGATVELLPAELQELVEKHQLELLRDPFAPEDKSSVVVSGKLADIVKVLDTQDITASSVPNIEYDDLPGFPKPARLRAFPPRHDIEKPDSVLDLELGEMEPDQFLRVVSNKMQQTHDPPAQAKRKDLWQENDFLDLEPELTSDDFTSLDAPLASTLPLSPPWHYKISNSLLGTIVSPKDDDTEIKVIVSPDNFGDDAKEENNRAEQALLNALDRLKIQWQITDDDIVVTASPKALRAALSQLPGRARLASEPAPLMQTGIVVGEDSDFEIPTEKVVVDKDGDFSFALDDHIPSIDGSDARVYDEDELLEAIRTKVHHKGLYQQLRAAIEDGPPKQKHHYTVELLKQGALHSDADALISELQPYELDARNTHGKVVVTGTALEIAYAMSQCDVTASPAEGHTKENPGNETLVRPKIHRARFNSETIASILEELNKEDPRSLHTRMLKKLFESGKDGLEGLRLVMNCLEKRLPGGKYWESLPPIKLDENDLGSPSEKDDQELDTRERKAYLEAVKEMTGAGKFGLKRLGYMGSLAGAGLLLLTGAGYYGKEASQRVKALVELNKTPGSTSWYERQQQQARVKSAAAAVADGPSDPAEFDKKEAKAREELSKLKALLKKHDEAGLTEAADAYLQRRAEIGSSRDAGGAAFGLGVVAILALLAAGLKALEPGEELREEAKNRIKALCKGWDDKLEAKIASYEEMRPGI